MVFDLSHFLQTQVMPYAGYGRGFAIRQSYV